MRPLGWQGRGRQGAGSRPLRQKPVVAPPRLVGAQLVLEEREERRPAQREVGGGQVHGEERLAELVDRRLHVRPHERERGGRPVPVQVSVPHFCVFMAPASSCWIR